MISNRKIREWMRTQMEDASTLDMNIFAWQNRTFDSSGLDLFFNERLAITSELPSTNEESVKTGIMFYDVIVDKASGTETQEDTAKILADIFKPANNKDVVIETGLKIDIDEATTGSNSDYDENRTQLPVRIQFRAYETD